MLRPVVKSIVEVIVEPVIKPDSPVVDNWILATGFWDDDGVWDDNAVWNDGPP